MSEQTTETTPAAPESPAPRRLFRSRDDRVIGGVAGGLGKYFNVDPVVFRIALVGLTLVSGIGLIVYLGALLFVPSEDGTEGAPPPRRSRWLAIAGLIVLGCLALWALSHGPFFGPGPGPPGGLLFLLLLGGLVYWLARGRGRGPGRRLAIAALVVLATPVLLAGSFFLSAMGGGAVMAGLVIGAGLLLVFAAFRGGYRWLVLPALLIAIPVGVVAAADIDIDGTKGEHVYVVTSLDELPAQYDVGAGRVEVDLRQVDFDRDAELKIDVGLGEAVLILPEDAELCVRTDAHVGAGYLRVFDRDAGGFDVDTTRTSSGATDSPELAVDADVGLGSLQIVNDPREADWENHDHDDDGWRGRGGRDYDELVPSLACTSAS